MDLDGKQIYSHKFQTGNLLLSCLETAAGGKRLGSQDVFAPVKNISIFKDF